MLTSQKDPESPYLGPKSLPRWLELDYFRRLRPLRGKRKWVTLAFFALTGVLATWSLLPGRHWSHQAGPVSAAHAMFNEDCTKCHTAAFQPLARLVSNDAGIRSTPDAACLQCHDGPIHHETQFRTPSCAECHREHRGVPRLARVADGHCTACHKDLKKDHPRTEFHNVAGFNIDHPEFKLIEQRAQDPTKLKFNHRHHMELDLQALRDKGAQGLMGYGEKLACATCHQPDADRRYMLPVNYERHCAQCHALWVPVAGRFEDKKVGAAAVEFGRKPAPHKDPETIRAVLRDRFLQFVRENPVVNSTPPASSANRGVPGLPAPGVTAEQWFWAKGQLQNAEELLFTEHQLNPAEQLLWRGAGGCRHCHLETPGVIRKPGELPTYEATGIPTDSPRRWYENSVFRHGSHGMLSCTQCHGQAAKSETSSELLLPSIDTCKRCHNPQVGARSDCAECHLYHNRKKDRGLDGSFTIEKCLRQEVETSGVSAP